MRDLERMILLQMIGLAWKEHLYDLDHLKQGIFLRGYAQKDPKIEYQKESFAMFEQMMNRIRENAIEYVFKLKMVPTPQRVQPQRMQEQKPEFSLEGAKSPEASGNGKAIAQAAPLFSAPAKTSPALAPVAKIGRNDLCPCGSGKKYKKCCGK